MGLGLLLFLMFGLPLIGTIASTAVNAGANAAATNSANKANAEAVEKTNEANAEQAELAYNRSLPVNQIAAMRAAGISESAAVQKITGGGSYAAPVMQSAQSVPRNYDFSSLFQGLTNAPANAIMAQMRGLEMSKVEEELRVMVEEEKRKKELHQIEMWERLYGKKAAEMLDSFGSKIVQTANDKGVKLDSLDSIDKIVNKLGLQDDPDWQNMPHSARSKLIESVRSQARENREITAAKDAHTKALDDLKNSEFGRTLTSKQINKVEAEAESAWQNVDAFNDATDARQKENAAREARADFERFMSAFGIAEARWKNSNFWTYDKDGNIVPTGKEMQRQGISDAWKFVGTFFGADLLQEILRGLVTIAK